MSIGKSVPSFATILTSRGINSPIMVTPKAVRFLDSCATEFRYATLKKFQSSIQRKSLWALPNPIAAIFIFHLCFDVFPRMFVPILAFVI